MALPSKLLPLNTCTRRLASALPTTVLSPLRPLTVPSPPTEEMVTVGAWVSTAKVKALERPSLPAASSWRAVTALPGPWSRLMRLAAVRV